MEDSLSLPKQETPRVLKVLEALKQASRDLRARPGPDPDDSNSSAVKALLELETESDAILSNDPNLSALSDLLARLKSLVETLQKSRAKQGLGSFVTRRVSAHSISRVAESIESEIQAWIDRESVECLARALREEREAKKPKPSKDEDELVNLLTRFEDRVSEGFNRELQDLILKSKIFASLESILCDSNRSKRIREHAAIVIGALIRFNKDVFVGQVLMGPTIKALVTMSTTCSMKVLCGLIRSIKSPLVDEIESNGEVARIVSSLSSQDLHMRVLAFECALDIGYFGRKEAIDAMLKEGLIEKLVELQRSELGGDLIELEAEGGHKKDKSGDNANEVCVGEVAEKSWKGGESQEKRFLERRPFASGVARFAVSLEVGEGLRQREKRAFKQQILLRVREACVSDAEAATILAEVLWGSSP